jgi:hypothetical protein
MLIFELVYIIYLIGRSMAAEIMDPDGLFPNCPRRL